MARKINYDNWSKEELIKELRRIKETKYGLVWHRDLPEEKIDILINPDARTPSEMFPNEMAGKPFPVLKETKGKEINGDKGKPVNLLIEGDNYHSLAVLNFTHQAMVDLIYIDPPYNTGNRSWRYNNDYIERDDPFKHSKWLAFMEKRLKLARNLLKPDGIIIITIDDYEIFPLGMLADEIFGEANRLATITVLNKKSGRTTDKFFATCHEYYLVYAKNAELANIHLFELSEEDIAAYKFRDDTSAYKWRDFLRTGGFSTPMERPNSYFPIYYDESSGAISIEKIKNAVEIFPIDSKGQKRVWRQTKPSLLQLIEVGDIKVEKNGKNQFSVRIKDRLKEGLKPKTVWDNPRYDAATHGTKLLESILGMSKMFDFPKSVYAVLDSIKIVTKDKKDAVILDFFAGSGTTGHAVLKLNKEDGGNRQFILCTNDEELGNNGEKIKHKICTDVCYPRLKKVIKGYKNTKGEKVAGLGGNLKYYVCDFVEAEPTDRNKRKLVSESTEMLCIRENAFELVQDESDFKIFKNSDKYLGIVFYEEAINDFKKATKKIKGHFNTYVFSLGDDPHEKQFADVKSKVTLCAIPEVILKVYREIFK
ncbi:MAG: site-specific DNA-methyltransferase [Deltaproteobacteria bacterium]|nr:site-specific DNA-methyltransferase [Deltaproteobacteria bacterium]